MDFCLVGPGRAGTSFRLALEQVGWRCRAVVGRGPSGQVDHTTLAEAADQVELIILAVPDAAIAEVARRIPPSSAPVVHLSGATTLAALEPHQHRGSVHPLVSLPDPETGARRLADGATFAVAGHPATRAVVDALGGQAIEVPDDRRAAYHAAATVGANHLVALCAQVERLAEAAGMPAGPYWELMARTLDNVAAGGAATALTGPAARGDLGTIRGHLEAMDVDEHALYLALAEAAATLAGHPGLAAAVTGRPLPRPQSGPGAGASADR